MVKVKGNQIKVKNSQVVKKSASVSGKSKVFDLLNIIKPKFKKLIANKWFRYSISIVLILLFFGYYSSKKNSFNDTVEFGFDAWEYQSLAVNFAKGHGIDRFGGIENFEEYKFGKFDQYYDGSMDIFIEGPQEVTFYRMPGYPIFLGITYKLFGVSPLIARKIQLLLLCFICGFLPIIGFSFWKNSGFISGIVAGCIAINSIWTYSLAIYTESLVMFSIFLIIIAYLLYKKRNTWYAIILLGLAIAWGLLIKGTLVFIPVLLGAYFLILSIKKRSRQILLHLIILVFAVSIPIVSWSVYASVKSGKIVSISTQRDDGLLDGNNEFANGGWAPGWKTDKNSFYNNDGLSNSSGIVRVANFYMHHPKLIVLLPVKKFIFGFIPFLALWIIVGLMFIDGLAYFLLNYFKSKKLFSLFHIFVGIPLIIYIMYLKFTNYDSLYDKLYLNTTNTVLVFITITLITLLWIIKNYKARKEMKFVFQIPVIFQVFFYNMLLITIIILADIWGKNSRYVLVLDFIFILVCVQYVLKYTINTVDFIYAKD